MSLITDALQKTQRPPTPAWEPPPAPPPHPPEPERPLRPFLPPSQYAWWPAVIALWIISLSVLLLWPQEGQTRSRAVRRRPAPIAPALTPTPAREPPEALQLPKPIAAFMPPMPATPPPIMPMTPLAWKVDGVILGMGKPTAIINGKVVEEGQEVRGAKVVRVTTERVELLHDGDLVEVPVEGP